jgi:CRP/FNR family transcriptional regulator, cyclic AMP receptor protein
MNALSTHGECEAFSSLFRGSLCEQFTGQQGRAFGAEEPVYHLGDAARSIYFLRRGLVKITALSEDGREIILSVHKPGEIFGEFCLCDGVRGESAVAMEPTEAVEIRLEALVQHLRGNEDAMYNFLVTVCQRLSRAYETIQELSFDPLRERLAKVLLRLADELGHETGEGTELAYYITQEELAQMLSARREVVSGALKRLREQRLVDYTRKGKLTIDRAALAAHVGGGAEDEVVRREIEKLRAAGGA